MKYRVPVLEQYQYQPLVKDKDLSTPPVSPVKGDRYIVGASSTGDWLGKEKNIAWFDGLVWKFDAPMKGMLTCVDDETVYYMYNGSTWNLFIEELGLGDMLKSIYDIDNNGIVDKAETVDDGVGNSSTASDIKDAVTKKHAHVNIAVLNAIEEAFTTALKTAYDDAVTKAHTHGNKLILDAIDVAFTTVLKSNYDEAYNKRGVYDPDLGVINFDI